MPLTPTDTLPPNPDVRIFFSGLMIIDADSAGKTCEVFVNRAALNHHFSVVVREKRIGRPDVVMMRLPCEFSFLPDLTGNQTVGLEIRANPPKGLAMYTGAPQPDGSETFRLAIDLESTMFHGKSIEVDEGGRPSILLNSGIFYAAEKTTPRMVINLKRGASIQQLGSFANLIGANISLGDEETLTIRWLDTGVVRALELKRKEGSTYEIYINNDPLFVNPETGEAHDEFKEYYKILDSIPPEERFELKVDPKSNPRGTPRTLCMTVVKGGGSGG